MYGFGNLYPTFPTYLTGLPEHAGVVPSEVSGSRPRRDGTETRLLGREIGHKFHHKYRMTYLVCALIVLYHSAKWISVFYQ